MGNKKSKKKEAFVSKDILDKIKPEEQTGSYAVDTDMNTYDNAEEDKPLFVPTDVKIENIKTGLRLEHISKDKQLVDYWLRHELQLGTILIKKMWKKLCGYTESFHHIAYKRSLMLERLKRTVRR